MNTQRVVGGCQIGAYLWIACFAALVGLSLNNTRPYVGDESYYTVASIEMLESGNLLVPTNSGRLRFQKPVLPYWLTIAGHAAFGVRLWSGRLAFLLLACGLLFLTYRFAFLVFRDHDAAFLNVLLLSSATVFLQHSRISMTDLPLAFFTTLSLYCFCRASEDARQLGRWYLAAFAAMGLAFASKGFLGVTPAVAIAASLIAARPVGFKRALASLAHPLYAIVFALLAFGWYAYVYRVYPDELVRQFGIEAANNLSSSVPQILGHLLFYAGAVLVYYLPFAAIALVLVLRRRPILPDSLRPVLWHVVVSILVLAIVLRRRDPDYLLVVMPGMTLLISAVLQRWNLGMVVRRMAAVWMIAQGLFFAGYPVVAGEPLRSLVGLWETQSQGDLAAFEMPARETGWLMAFTHGRLRAYEPGSPLVILEDSTLASFARQAPNPFQIVGEARRLRDVTFDDLRPAPVYRRYLLIRSSPRN